MPTHAQQVRRRLAALNAEVTDTSPRAGLRLTALLPAGVAWNATGNHTVSADYEPGNRDAGFTALLGIIRQGTFECDAAACERCGRPAAGNSAGPAGESLTVAISGKAMSAIQGSELYQRPQLYTDPADADHDAAQRAGAALKAAPRRQRGKGHQYAVTADPAALAVIADYCQTVGEGLADGTDPDTRAEGTALLTAAERIRDTARAHALAA